MLWCGVVFCMWEVFFACSLVGVCCDYKGGWCCWLVYGNDLDASFLDDCVLGVNVWRDGVVICNDYCVCVEMWMV